VAGEPPERLTLGSDGPFAPPLGLTRTVDYVRADVHECVVTERDALRAQLAAATDALRAAAEQDVHAAQCARDALRSMGEDWT
jgi:hypothetical protein